MRPFRSHPDELISASLSRSLTPTERRELDEHLAACPDCRQTLEAFTQQRQLLAGLDQPAAPRDLHRQVWAGIESARVGPAWWRRPQTLVAGVASLATVAAALLLAAVLLNRQAPPTGSSQSPAPSSSATAAPSATASASLAPATPAPMPLGMRPGDLVYLSVTGPKEARVLTVIDDASGASLKPASPGASGSGWDQVKRASLAPDGRALAFAMESGEKGTWRILVTNLDSRASVQVGETVPFAFGRRLLWSPDGRYLAFTVGSQQAAGESDAWLYDRTTGASRPITSSGNAYAASWAPLAGGNETLWLGLGATSPSSVAIRFAAAGGIPSGNLLDHPAVTAPGVFLPLVSPDGRWAIFWTGTMTAADTQGWIFAKGGMPRLRMTADAVSTWPSAGELLGDLTPAPDGEAFASGEVTWAGDSDAYAFWAGEWTGIPEGAGYPDVNGVYIGRAWEQSAGKQTAVNLGDMTTPDNNALAVVDVALSPDASLAAVTLAYPTPEFGASAYLRTVKLIQGAPQDVGSGGITPPPWLGPGVFVPTSAGG